jgi:hypothetical protein
MEYQRRKGKREKWIDPNPMGDISLLKIIRKNVGIVARSGILEEIARKRRRRVRRKGMILMIILKNILKRMVEMPLLYPWKPMQARVNG